MNIGCILYYAIDTFDFFSHNGKMHLGGEDFDNILLDYCIEKFKKQKMDKHL